MTASTLEKRFTALLQNNLIDVKKIVRYNLEIILHQEGDYSPPLDYNNKK